ncbi:NAD(P)/FAD-dependent oxidoreductase [Sphingobium boeckii]|uniref:Glycine/D-amino acid oxidase-like deaminating enzyme n=1 Tax=Sphingobium boeckii TaxID=1082345 RepID=A0A7W9AJM0_9SPHN|nr:FAD-binding oxidoreductase [Sphingobium boeckii]MBB5686865.1 glycine/D-amino acid oxidase-like deaminating enzyme [Sphingobium boeckii]
MSKTDVLIIGGGLIGCATALHLARAGASVRLVEAGDINAGASGQNAGSLHFQMERRFLENGAALADQAARIIALNRLAIDEWRGLEVDLGVDLHVSQKGGLMVAETPEQVALLEAKSRREISGGLATQLLDGDAARALCPALGPDVLAASYLADEGHADPRALTPAFAHAAAEAGAVISTRQHVLSITRRSPGGFDVAAKKGDEMETLQADQIFVAAGAWTPAVCALANLHIPLFPVALLMNATERTGPILPQLIQHVGRRLSMKQAYAGNVIIGGGWPSRLAQRPDGGFDLNARASIIPLSRSGNLRAAIDIVPQIGALNLIRSWTGVTTISADQLPIAGAVSRVPGFYVAAGGSAFTLGPTFARLIARVMGGERVEALDVLSPDRFNHLNSFMG